MNFFFRVEGGILFQEEERKKLLKGVVKGGGQRNQISRDVAPRTSLGEGPGRVQAGIVQGPRMGLKFREKNNGGRVVRLPDKTDEKV